MSSCNRRNSRYRICYRWYWCWFNRRYFRWRIGRTACGFCKL